MLFEKILISVIHRDMLEQAKALIDKLKADPTINMEEDWKMLSIFIGGNNIRVSCLNWVN